MPDSYIDDAIDAPHGFDEMVLPAVSRTLSPLIDYIADEVHNRTIVHALL